MTAALADIVGNVDEFLTQVKAEVEAAGIELSGRVIDHVCFRVATQEEYDAAKLRFEQIAVMLHEAKIGGRPIATYKLHEPIVHGPHTIWCIELPSPKANSPYATGLEHFEVVIDSPFEAFMASHAALPWDTSAINKSINADIRLPLSGGRSVKFHHDTLENVIKLEIEMGM